MAFLTLSVENLENLNGHMIRLEKKLVRLVWFGWLVRLVGWLVRLVGWFGWLVGLVGFVGWLGWLVG